VKSGGVGTAKPLKYPKQKTAGREKGGKWTSESPPFSILGVERVEHTKEHSASRSQRKEVLSLLSSPVDHEARHEDIRHKRHPETGGWLFKTKSYQEWLQGSATVLWCHGTCKPNI